MTYPLLPIAQQFDAARRVLVAGAGGGFDVFSGLPLYFALRAAGKDVWLANLSFSNLPPDTAGEHLTPECVRVTADAVGSPRYFPERDLSRWFRDARGEEVPVYALHRVGPKPLRAAYEAIVARHGVDTIVLADGGTDSLMRGDEQGLGTPVEDMSSIAAAHAVAGVPRKLLVCLGFGVDAFHGVSHAHVLEAIADLSRAGGYLGAWSLLRGQPEVELFRDATRHVLGCTAGRESIVCTSILAALDGHFGDHHATDRTAGSELFVNPLMSMYWAFDLAAVARRALYLPGIAELSGWAAVDEHIDTFHAVFEATNRLRPHRPLPM